MAENIMNMDETSIAEMNRLREAGELSRAVSDDIERETRRYPHELQGGAYG